ncbi:lytic transglycosylase domain-containing protein [Roseomonas indoligenes]|uniref:Lytic transglycosylase domain-containing protein n=1 Tax=Roseomonas indoligenes TaxID=2820811 RepID=A0A940MWM6_9PROT|nr:lytic transglycosylase domain-containing protein [Pararoseomonas indoligenes]MBP0492360.1 lytic transglycosylase domain-containing protein [Pararoseomonas indoligenes]
MRLLSLILILLPGLALAQPSSTLLCRAAIASAEREYGLPAGLLAAIGRVESGRRDPITGENGPWPWTMNAEGTGKFFSSKAEAVAEVRQLRAGGMRLIDIGCMQINLHHHPDAFASIEDGFDPLTNARYAARFLKGLQATSGDWMVAAGHYHSQTPARAEAYRAQVALRLPEEQRQAGGAPAWQPGWSNQPAGPRFPVAVAATPGMSIRAAPPPTIMRTASPAASESGERGRGLDAYRAMAIPLASRAPAMLVRGWPAAGG